jgi:hypothetical protein
MAERAREASALRWRRGGKIHHLYRRSTVETTSSAKQRSSRRSPRGGRRPSRCSRLRRFLGAELVRQPLLIRYIAAAWVSGRRRATQWPRITVVVALALLPYLRSSAPSARVHSRGRRLTRCCWCCGCPDDRADPPVCDRRAFSQGDRISKLVVFLVAPTFFQVFNPRGVGCMRGRLFSSPRALLWFFAGRGLATRRAARPSAASS